jgi:hypothetical protein
MKDWRVYCRSAFNALCANTELWNDPASLRPITRIYYDLVFCSGYNRSGLISEAAMNDAKKRTNDHCLSPQFIARMIMDNPDVYLKDYENFENLFNLARTTVCVTKDENRQLSLLTDNRGIDYKVYVPTNLKYKHLGIKLYEKVGQQYNNAVEYDGDVGDIAPQDLLNYEKQFLIK